MIAVSDDLVFAELRRDLMGQALGGWDSDAIGQSMSCNGTLDVLKEHDDFVPVIAPVQSDQIRVGRHLRRPRRPAFRVVGVNYDIEELLTGSEELH